MDGLARLHGDRERARPAGGEDVDHVDARLDEPRVQRVAGDVPGRAEAAHGRAEAAYGRADEVNSRVSRLWGNRHKRDVVETVHVQFGFDRWDLSDGAQTALLQISKELKENPLLTVDLEGYTDPTGPQAYNVSLSQRRVESVRRFLVLNGADLSRIYSVGLGSLNGKEERAALKRRVTVRVMVNAID